jgi:hypothetical protein
MVFMLAFGVLIAFVSRYYLLPAIDAAKHATPREKRWLMASSRLLLAVILFVIVAGIFLTFRIGRFFFPRHGPAMRTQTTYIDAWAESAKRLESPDQPSNN